MKHLNVELNPEIKNAIEERRKKILLVVYSICIFIFISHNLADFFYAHYTIIPFRTVILFFILLSFFTFYKKGAYERASYSIVFILSIATLGVLIPNKFDNFTPAFVFPFILAAFSLFSWKKGSFYSGIVLFLLILLPLMFRDYFENSAFLHNPLAVFNFLFVIIISLVFALYYETTRIDAYKRLINANTKKDLLYNEIHHRVQNNLNIVSSILAIQMEKEDKRVQKIIQVSKNRIDSMAMVHSMLYVSNDLEKVNAKRFIEKLANTIQSTMDSYNVSLIFHIQEVELSLNEIMPIGLIINELLTNSFKYAFFNILHPTINIALNLEKNCVFFSYCDNGVGYKTDVERGLGLRLVDLNVKQLKGVLDMVYENGLCYKIYYKRNINV